MNAATLLLVFCIIFGETAVFCEGRIGGTTERCLCREINLQKRVKPSRVVKSMVFPPSAFCSRTEIIITIEKGRKICLDPNGKQGKLILRQKQMKAAKPRRGNKQKKTKQKD